MPRSPLDRLGINWGAISEKIAEVAKTDLGDILVAIGTGVNTLRKARRRREIEDEEDEEDDEEDED